MSVSRYTPASGPAQRISSHRVGSRRSCASLHQHKLTERGLRSEAGPPPDMRGDPSSGCYRCGRLSYWRVGKPSIRTTRASGLFEVQSDFARDRSGCQEGGAEAPQTRSMLTVSRNIFFFFQFFCFAFRSTFLANDADRNSKTFTKQRKREKN